MSVLDTLLPSYLTEERKNRLRSSLSQFNDDNLSNKKYTHFYSKHHHDIFLQGDLVRELRFASFDYHSGNYHKKYYDAIIISNTCDFDPENNSGLRKNVLLSPILPLQEYVSALKSEGVEDIENKIVQIKNQLYSNLLYLPETKDRQEYVVPLDIIQEISKDELNQLITDIDDNRIETLDYYGYYLFILKLSYHLCRLPEEKFRK